LRPTRRVCEARVSRSSRERERAGGIDRHSLSVEGDGKRESVCVMRVGYGRRTYLTERERERSDGFSNILKHSLVNAAAIFASLPPPRLQMNARHARSLTVLLQAGDRPGQRGAPCDGDGIPCPSVKKTAATTIITEKSNRSVGWQEGGSNEKTHLIAREVVSKDTREDAAIRAVLLLRRARRRGHELPSVRVKRLRLFVLHLIMEVSTVA
jgi:hypothetical protein